jgi:two-component system NarL family response regulator
MARQSGKTNDIFVAVSSSDAPARVGGVIRILIADDHALVRAGLVALINRNPTMNVVAEATNGSEAVALFREHRPDVTLMDLQMPVMGGLEAIAAIRSIHAGARIMILTSHGGDEPIFRGLQAGARGYCLKDSSPEELCSAITSVYNGHRRLPDRIAAKLIERMSTTELTPREGDVLRLIASGKTNHQIGAALFIGEGTVKTHVNNILNKLAAHDRTEAVIIALKRGLITLE